MARKVRDADLDTRAARRKLPRRYKPHWRRLDAELHIGYQRSPNSDKPGQWFARLYHGSGKYRRVPLGDADDQLGDGESADGVHVLDFFQAQDKARAQKVRLLSGDIKPAEPLTVRKAIEDYVDGLDVSPRSKKDMRYRAGAWIYPYFGNKLVTSLKTDELRKWLTTIANAPARRRTAKGKPQQFRVRTGEPTSRRATANKSLTLLKAALNRAFSDGLVEANRAWREVKALKDADAVRIQRLKDIDEARRFINACQPKEFRDLVIGGLATGARYSELAALKVEDFNAGKASGGTLLIRKSKSGKSRVIALTPENTEFIAALVAGRKADDFVFKMPNGKQWRRNAQIGPMKAACSRAKVEIGFHALRHTFASFAVEAGIDLLVVARQLGHATTAMTERHYANLRDDFIAKEIRRGTPDLGLTPSNVKELRRG